MDAELMEMMEKMADFEYEFLDVEMPVSCQIPKISCQDNYNTTNEGEKKDTVMRHLTMLDVATSRTEKFLPSICSITYDEMDDRKVSAQDRDNCVMTLRCLHLFYGYSPETFSLAVNLLDRFITKVRVQPKYLACISTTCYFIASKTIEENSDAPSAGELVHISQCGGRSQDLLRMEAIILEKIGWELNAVTPLTFLFIFYAMYEQKWPHLAETGLLAATIAKLEVCNGHYGFYAFQPSCLALALLSCGLQELDEVEDLADMLSAVLDMQIYCQIRDEEFLQCRGMVVEFLVYYYSHKLNVPKQRMIWRISLRTLNQMKPSHHHSTDLPTICEDEKEEHPLGEEDEGTVDEQHDDDHDISQVEDTDVTDSGISITSNHCHVSTESISSSSTSTSSPADAELCHFVDTRDQSEKESSDGPWIKVGPRGRHTPYVKRLKKSHVPLDTSQ